MRVGRDAKRPRRPQDDCIGPEKARPENRSGRGAASAVSIPDSARGRSRRARANHRLDACLEEFWIESVPVDAALDALRRPGRAGRPPRPQECRQIRRVYLAVVHDLAGTSRRAGRGAVAPVSQQDLNRNRYVVRGLCGWGVNPSWKEVSAGRSSSRRNRCSCRRCTPAGRARRTRPTHRGESEGRAR